MLSLLQPQLRKYHPNEIKCITFLMELKSCAGICCGKTEFCCLQKDGLGCQRKLRGEDDRSRSLAGEESKVCLVCGQWRLQREGKQQEHSGPSIPACCCQPDFLGLCLHAFLC